MIKLKIFLPAMLAIAVGCQDHKTNEIKTESMPVSVVDRTEELLQGKWVSSEDPTNFVVFEGNQRKEIAAGTKDWEAESFLLVTQCGDTSARSIANAEHKYIYCKESDDCWEILGVSYERLLLSYPAKGNTLNYTRVSPAP